MTRLASPVVVFSTRHNLEATVQHLPREYLPPPVRAFCLDLERALSIERNDERSARGAARRQAGSR